MKTTIIAIILFLFMLMTPLGANAKTVGLVVIPGDREMATIEAAIAFINNRVGEPILTLVQSGQMADIFINPVLFFEDDNNLGITQTEPGVPTFVQYSILLKDDVKLLTIVHEFGHALGLPHTQDKNSLMYPTADEGGKDFTAEDIELLKFLNRKELGYELRPIDKKKAKK